MCSGSTGFTEESSTIDELWELDEQNVTHVLPARPTREGKDGKKLDDYLQWLIEKSPAVRPGKQIDPSLGDPSRFLLLMREVPFGPGWLDRLCL